MTIPEIMTNMIKQVIAKSDVQIPLLCKSFSYFSLFFLITVNGSNQTMYPHEFDGSWRTTTHSNLQPQPQPQPGRSINNFSKFRPVQPTPTFDMPATSEPIPSWFQNRWRRYTRRLRKPSFHPLILVVPILVVPTSQRSPQRELSDM
jgi:hypothetical protein